MLYKLAQADDTIIRSLCHTSSYTLIIPSVYSSVIDSTALSSNQGSETHQSPQTSYTDSYSRNT